MLDVCDVFSLPCTRAHSAPSQENVMLGAYSPVELRVKTKGQEINCRTYIMNSCVYAPPSPQYLQVPHSPVGWFHGPWLSCCCCGSSLVEKPGAWPGLT